MKFVILTLIAGLALPAFAESTAKDGLARLQANLENTKGNLEDYKKNLKIVQDNLAEGRQSQSSGRHSGQISGRFCSRQPDGPENGRSP